MKRIRHLLVAVGVIGSLALPAFADEGTAPTAVDDYAETEEKVTHIYVLNNDTAAEGDSLDPTSLSLVSSPSHGDAVVIAKGAVRVKYTVTATESFTDRFRYSICTSAGPCATATVIVNYLATPTTTTSTTTSTTATTSTTTSTTATTSTTTSTTSTTTAPATSTTLGAGPPPTSPPAQETPTTSHSPDDSAAGESTATTTSVAEPMGDRPNGPPLPPEDPFSSSATTFAAGTTIGDPSAPQFKADMFYLGQTGRDTIRMVATPALMVSGIIGFLMTGLPQNAFGTALGFLVAFKRKRQLEQDAENPSGQSDSP